MVKILAVLLLALAGFYLGYKLYKSNKENNPILSLYASLTMICALSGGIVLIAFLLLKGDHWTGENKMILRYILVSCLTISFLFLAAKLIIRGRKGENRMAQIAGLTWVLVTLLASGYALSYVSKMNDGWTAERQKQLMEQCVKYNDTGSAYDCPCYTKAVMKKYKTNEAYTAAMSSDAGVVFNSEMDEECACGSKSYSEKDIETIDF